jgi:hypothetical protein
MKLNMAFRAFLTLDLELHIGLRNLIQTFTIDILREVGFTKMQSTC